jgi:hypothetical protein
MRFVLKLVAILASVIGLMAIITGSSVLLGFFDPGYTYFTALIVYNIILGVISVITGILVWMKNHKSLLLSYIIALSHIIVLILLLSIFRDIISEESIVAMVIRSLAWVLFSVVLKKANFSQIKGQI